MNLDDLIGRVESTHKRYLEEKASFKLQKETDNKTISDLSEQINKLNEDLEKTQKELEDAKNNLASNTLKNEESEKQSTIKSNRLNDEVVRLRKEVEELQKNSERFDEFRQSLQSEILDAHTETSNVTNKLHAVEVSKNDIATAFEELKVKYNNLISESSQIPDLTSKIQSLSSEKTNLETKIEELSSLISEQEIKIGELNSTISKKDELIISLRNTAPTKKATNLNLQEFIDSTIPVPEDSAAINIRQVKRGSEITNSTVPYRFGRTSPKVMGQVLTLVDGLYENVSINEEGIYLLNDPYTVLPKIDMDQNTYNVAIQRLQAMSCKGKPLVFISDGNYYGTLSVRELKNYLIES